MKNVSDAYNFRRRINVLLSFNEKCLTTVFVTVRTLYATALRTQRGFFSQTLVGDGVVLYFAIGEQALAKEYLQHCLMRAVAAAKVVGRANRKMKSLHMTHPASVTAGEEDSAAERLCRLLVNEVTGLLEDEPAAAGSANVNGVLLATMTVGGKKRSSSSPSVPPIRGNSAGRPRDRLLASCWTNQMVERSKLVDRRGGGSGGGGSESSVRTSSVIGSFLTAVLKHRLNDAESLRAVRMVASALYQQQAADAAAPQGGEVGESMEGNGTHQWRGGEGDDDPTTAAVRAVVDAPPIIPEWSATMMLER